MKPPLLVLVTVALAAALIGCQATRQGAQDDQSYQPPDKDDRALLAKLTPFFESEHLEPGEFADVKAIGNAAVPLLEKIVATGAPPEKVQAHKEHLERTYTRLEEYRASHPNDTNFKLPLTRERYVGLYLQNYDRHYRSRAVGALGAIGSPAAKDALMRLAKLDLDADVKHAIDKALNPKKP
jgi:hypothetical protein